nr:GH32 C-terminal domain-containing protein [Cesiribacter andamanensis]
MLLLAFLAEAYGQAYQEPYRPQYHFSPYVNWINDPCGMVYLDGEYHLMYQYNPQGTQWGNMSWGHAVSTDLVHWKPLPTALLPDAQGQIFSGGAVIDHHNTAGFGAGAMVALYTSAGTTQKQSLAYSLDKGRSWKKYSGNPVLPNPGKADFRDPQVFWHAESSKWIMTLAVLDQIDFYSSANLKEWTYESSFGKGLGAHGGVWECPDLFPLAVEGQAEPLWVLMVSLNPGSPSGGSGTQYFLGHFDGATFRLSDEFSAHLQQEKALPEGVLFEDFEGESYNGWTVEGTAFGSRPAAGTLANQQPVEGYLGQQLVNSYLNGDEPQGRLLSAFFTIEHAYINFLIGGGNLAGLAEIRLLINNEVVATATGKDGEQLRWHAWDVHQHQGQQARIEIVDYASGGWGHINVDHIYFANEPLIDDAGTPFWADWGPDFYAGRSWENAPTSAYERVWLAWMNNWSYAGALPTSSWRGSMSLPRALSLQRNAAGAIRLYQQPVTELNSLRANQAHITYAQHSIQALNEQLTADKVSGTRYELDFTLLPSTTSTNTGVRLRKGHGEYTEVGYDPLRQAVYLDRKESGFSFSGTYEKVFYAPLEGQQPQELRFQIFVDESSVEVFVNGGAVVQTARIFPSAQANQIQFFGSEEVAVASLDFWMMKSIWRPEEPVLATGNDPLLQASVAIYPNPAKETLQIQSPEPVEAVTLYALTGAQLPLQHRPDATGARVFLPAQQSTGMRFLKIDFRGGKTVIKKIIIE